MAGTILIVDDDCGMSDLLKDALKTRGFEAECVYDAAEAVSAMQHGSIAAVVADVRMPGTDGIDLCRLIKTRWPTIPVLMMTAFGDLDAAILARNAGALAFLAKPFEAQALAEALHRALDPI
jgi:DNA-binding NtrC family response regulator